MYIYLITLCVTFVLIYIIIVFILPINNYKQISNYYHDVNITDLSLNKVSIYNECIQIYKTSSWINMSNNWKIFPLYVDNKIIVNKYYNISSFLKTLHQLHFATLIYISPHTKILPYKSDDNYKCYQYGIIVPNGCYISVSDEDIPPSYAETTKTKNKYYYDENNEIIEETKYYKQFEWIIIDDSQTHYIENPTKFDMLLLVLYM